MFYSGTKADDLIQQLEVECNISPSIDTEQYLHWINELEQLLYSDIIREQREGDTEANKTADYRGVISLSSFNADDEEEVRFEDIHGVFIDNGSTLLQLTKTTLLSANFFDNCYYKYNDDLYISAKGNIDGVKVIYFVRPKLKSTSNDDDLDIMLPPEFLDLMKAYIRSKVYALANDDELCAKWTNEYNATLESFKVWIMSKQPQFGL